MSGRILVEQIKQEFLRHRDSPQDVPLPVEIENVGTVFVGDEKRTIRSHGDALRIESKRVQRVRVAERKRAADEVLTFLVLEKSRIEQRCGDVGKAGSHVHRDVEKMKTVEVWLLSSAVERSTVRRSDEHVVVPGVGEPGTKAAKRRAQDARSDLWGRIERANKTVESR